MFGIVSNYTETVNEVSNCMMVDVLNIHLKLLAINLRLKQFGSKSFSSHSQFHESKCMQSDQQIRSDQLLSHVRLFATPWTAARQASLFITNSRRSLRLTSIESVMPSSHLNLCRPLSSWPQSLPASESFPMSQLFTWGGQSPGVSALASFLPKKSQGWSPSVWTVWISLQSKGLSRVFSNTTVQNHQFFGAQPSSQSNSHIHTWPQEKT